MIGCVDVPGLHGLSLSNQTLKHTLLSQCNIRYWVVDPDNLPNTTAIRAAFLGEQAVVKEALERVRTEDEFNQTRASSEGRAIAPTPPPGQRLCPDGSPYVHRPAKP